MWLWVGTLGVAFFHAFGTTVPLTIAWLLSLFAVQRDARTISILCLASGIIIDSVLVRPLGQTSVFLLAMLSIVSLYERKFEIASAPFLAASSFVGSTVFLTLFGYTNVVSQSIIATILTVIMFRTLKFYRV